MRPTRIFFVIGFACAAFVTTCFVLKHAGPGEQPAEPGPTQPLVYPQGASLDHARPTPGATGPRGNPAAHASDAAADSTQTRLQNHSPVQTGTPGLNTDWVSEMLSEVPGALHRQLESETADSTWSVGMESELRDYLLQHLDPSKVSFQNVECRSSLCEIQLITSSPGLRETLEQMTARDWWATYDLKGKPFIVTAQYNDKPPVVLTYVTRDPQQ